MAIRLRLADGTSVESDNVEDLARFYQHLSRNGDHKQKKSQTVLATENGNGDLEPLPETASGLVKLLFAEQDGLDTSVLAKGLGVGPRGIGGFITSLSNWGRRNGFASKKHLLVKGRRADDKSIRTMTLHKHFRQVLKEGKVPGMKLDT
jgi:hypothetical protein